MASYAVEACRSCSAEIIWTVTEAGKAMPVDAEPSPDGTVQLRERPGMQPLAVVIKSVASRFGKTLRKSHFASCAQASTWRRTRSHA